MMSPPQILDLFDHAGGPVEQLFEVESFLKTSGAGARDLIVYYVGHGCVTRAPRDRWQLALVRLIALWS
jgi:hypothetical protein